MDCVINDDNRTNWKKIYVFKNVTHFFWIQLTKISAKMSIIFRLAGKR